MADPKGLVPFEPGGEGVHDPGPLPLFSYGTLLDRRFLAQMLGRAVPCEPARLDGFRVEVLPAFDWPVLARAPGEAVFGLLYRGLGAEDLRRLDAYEGVDEGLYLRVVVAVQVTEDAPAEPAFAYLPTGRTMSRGARP